MTDEPIHDLPSDPELRAKAEKTLQRVRAGMESQTQVPLVGQIVRLIKDISGKAEKMSVDDLVEAISAEPTTLARIMAVASSMVYNPTGREITSLHQAVSVVGFERVRYLAVSILLLENAQSEFTAEANRELAGVALVSGLMAGEMGRRFLPIDPDVAFVCAALRSYGRMLMATFMAQDYATMMRLSTEGPTDETFRTTFGLTPIELGHELLAGQQLPRIILDSLVDISEESRKHASQNPSLALIAAADFSLRMADILQSPKLTNENFQAHVEALTHQYDGAFLMPEEPLKELITRINLTLSAFSNKSGLPRNSVVLFRRLDCLATGRPVPPSFKSTARTTVPAPVSTATPARKEPPQRDEPTLRAAKSINACIVTITQLVREPHPDLRRIFELLLQTLHQTLDLNSCLIFIRHRQSGLFRVTRGLGPLFQFARDTLALDPATSTVFAEALSQSQNVLIRDPNEPAVRATVPEWLCAPGQSVPILLLPIRNPAGTFALVCATCNDVKGFELAERLQPELRHLRSQVALVGDILA